MFGRVCSFMVSSIKPWEAPWGGMTQGAFQSRRGQRLHGWFAKMPRWEPVALIIFGRARRWSTIVVRRGAENCGLSRCHRWITRHLSNVVCLLAVPASVVTDRHLLPSVYASRYQPKREMIFHLLYSYPGACRPA